MKFLNFGSCNIDFVYSLDHIVVVGETLSTDGLCVFPGGKGLNQSIALARAGACVYHAGCVGADGELLLNTLKENGVDVSYVRCVEEKSGHAIIQVNREGDNSIFLYAGANAAITREYVDEVLADFGCGDILLLQNEINDLKYIIEQAHDRGMFIVLNPSPINQTITELNFHQLSCIVLNEVEMRDISGCENVEEGLDVLTSRYPDLQIVLTLGKNGCVYSHETTRVTHPIFETTVVDTTAAGDTFTGYFVAELSKKVPIKQVLRTASCAAAISVSRAGAAPSIPQRAEVMEGLKTMAVKEDHEKENHINRRIERYIEGNINTATLEGLSELLSYSTVYSGVIVKRITGRSFKKLLQEKRIALAAQLLQDTDLSAGEIIHRIGYQNETYFRRMFKAVYGKNPQEYRAACREGKREI